MRRKLFANVESPEVLDISYRIEGDKRERIRLAKRFLSLKLEFPAITLPEAIVYDKLDRDREEFKYQAEIGGGRIRLGGKLPDFFLPFRGGLVLEILGDYWHASKRARENDLVRENALLQSTVEGVQVGQVIELWESTLLSADRDRAIDLALVGIEVARVLS